MKSSKRLSLFALAGSLILSASVEAADTAKWKTTGLQQANSMGAGAAPIPKSGKFRVFVLMGQSNMAGAARAKNLEPPYTEKHERIRIWANGRWEYFDTFKQLVSDVRADLGVPDLPVVVPVSMSAETLLEAILSNISDEDLAEAKKSANTPPENDIELLKVLVPYLENNPTPDLKKRSGKRPYILSVRLAQGRAGREIPGTTTISHGKLPVLDDGIHLNTEGQIMLGKFTASAIEEYYQKKAAQKGSSTPGEKK